jgi:diadenylate cyclase
MVDLTQRPIRNPKSAIRVSMSDLWYLVQRLNWLSALDIALVALVFFALLQLVRGTQAVQLLRGVIILAVIILLMGNALKLPAFSWLVRNAIPALLVALPVIFQPELRRALERLGRTVGGTSAYLTPSARELSNADIIDEVCTACTRLSERHHGALMVLERSTGLEEFIESGVQLDSRVTSELLLTVFFPNTALHDGAAIVRNGRIVAAACVLPLASGTYADRQMGLRHRAAIGITEATDAVAVVVSEETGTISVARNGRMIRRLDGKRLRKILQVSYPTPRPPSFSEWVKGVRDRVEDAFGNPKL